MFYLCHGSVGVVVMILTTDNVSISRSCITCFSFRLFIISRNACLVCEGRYFGFKTCCRTWRGSAAQRNFIMRDVVVTHAAASLRGKQSEDKRKDTFARGLKGRNLIFFFFVRRTEKGEEAEHSPGTLPCIVPRAFEPHTCCTPL